MITESVWNRFAALSISLAAIAASSAQAAEADRFADVRVTAQPVSGSVYMLTGAGGNIGVSVGADGTLIVDDQYAPLADRIQAALNGLGGSKPRLVLNTHFHGDHTGSNAYFGAIGTIIAHDNVRLRLLTEGTDRAALPLITYSDRVTVHFNDDEIQVIHVPAGHTDGDSLVWFKTANVVHMGDQLFTGMFPYIDTGSGGSVAGFVANLEMALQMLPADIHVIPGHGTLTDVGAIKDCIEMIHATRKIVADAAAAGESADEIVAAGLGEQWADFGTGFINEERWIRILLTEVGDGG